MLCWFLVVGVVEVRVGSLFLLGGEGAWWLLRFDLGLMSVSQVCRCW